MNTILFENNELSDWKDYIHSKLAYPNLFRIHDEPEHLTAIYSLTNQTIIYFNWVDKKKALLYDVQFSNTEYKGRSGDILNQIVEEFDDVRGLSFNLNNLIAVNNILDIPLFQGWYSVEYSLAHMNYKRESYVDKDKLELLCKESRWYTILFYPLLTSLLLLKIIGKERMHYIAPIIP